MGPVTDSKRTDRVYDFMKGMMIGMLSTLVAGMAVLYMLNMTHVVAISIIGVPEVHQVLTWTYDNLRLSVIPFSLVLLLFFWTLTTLRADLKNNTITMEKAGQAEQLTEYWIRIFFGIGVIWTAIGLRNALLSGVGGLDAASAARLGAFAILQRLVDGGILLALSTTIVGGIGGYVMHLIKAFVVGKKLQAFYLAADARQAQAVDHLLTSIAGDLSVLVKRTETAGEAGP